MKKQVLVSVLGASLLGFAASPAVAEQSARLTIEIRGITESQGQAVFVLMDSASSHQGDTPIYAKKITPIVERSVQASFDLPAGDYSAVVYHDLNGNGKLDTYFFGKPKEPYGFSNDARGIFGIPSFADARFEIGASEQVHRIQVR